jgi:hypothetical protein
MAFAVIKSKPYRWYDDADQFYAPKDGWQKDLKFLKACIELTQKHQHNLISDQIQQLIMIVNNEEKIKIINKLGIVEFQIDNFFTKINYDENIDGNLIDYVYQKANQEYHVY